MHCNRKWEMLNHGWQCPVCNRTKRQILQWGKRVGSNALRYGDIGWKAGIHTHHGQEMGKGRFPPTLVCGACNYLDARLKRKIGIGNEFSFSPIEMRECLVLARHNDKIRDCDIDFETAQTIYATYVHARPRKIYNSLQQRNHYSILKKYTHLAILTL